MQNKGRHGRESIFVRLKFYFASRSVFACWIRTFLLLFVITFVWIQVAFGNIFWTKNSKETPFEAPAGKLISIKNESRYEEQKHDIKPVTTTIQLHNISARVLELREIIRRNNEEQRILNAEAFGPLTNDSLVIVIQVHNRIIYLKYLIESLSKAKYINEALLVFSHDLYDENINRLIQSITFCKVTQIFLPYSVETHPDEFPGDDPNDCPRDIGKPRALESHCNSAEHPDKYGHYRESKFAQIKHHWWWKANHAFNRLTITKEYTGLITFLEEDHYVAEDFIHMLKIMDQKCAKIADCYFLGLGFHVNLKSYGTLKGTDEVQMNPLTTNLGLTFNRTTFNVLLSCAKQFCEYDDYNWDWSLNYIAQSCSKTVLRSLICAGPRVIHTGECGTHIHKNDCKEDSLISKIEKLFDNSKDKLYPSSVTLNDPLTKQAKVLANGGWGDTRDHELCINMTKR